MSSAFSPRAARNIELLIGPALSLGSLLMYARTLSPSVGGTVDSPEFQHAAYSLSVAHPTGYPLYLLLGRAWITLFPFGNPAYRMNFLSALFAALAVWVLYALVKHITGSTVAGAASAALYAVLPIPWSQASVAEVNSLHTLLVGLSFLSVVLWTRGRIPLPVLALVLGSAISHHRTALLYVPILALYGFLARRQRGSTRIKRAEIPLSVLLMLLPLATYIYLPLRAYTTPWYTNTWTGFLQHVAGESALSMINVGFGRALLGRVRQLLADQIFKGPQGSVFFVIGLLGLAVLIFEFVRRWRARKRGNEVARPTARFAFEEVQLGPAAVAVLAFAVGIGFASIYQIFDIVDYLGVPVFMWGIVSGIAFAAVAKVVAVAISRLGSTPESATARRIAQGLVVAVAALLALFTASQSLTSKSVQVDYSKLDRQGYWNTVKQELESARPGTILIGDWYELNEALYFQRVEGWRPDFVGVPLDSTYQGEGAQVDRWLAEGRQVFLLGHYEPVLSRFEAEVRGPVTFGSEVRGPLWQVLGRRTQVETPPMAHEINRRFGSNMLLVGYTLSPESEMQPGDTLDLKLYWQATERVYERYTVFTHIIDVRGDKVGQKDDEPQRGYKPTVIWQPGEIVVDQLEIPISSTAAPGTYRIVIGMYNSVTQQRVAAFSADGTSLGDYATLVEIVVPAQ